MSQTKNIAEKGSTQNKILKQGSFLKKLFSSSADTHEDEASDSSNEIEILKKVTSQATTYLNHLLKDNQFLYKLTDEEIATTQGDIEYIRLKTEIAVDEYNKVIAEDATSIVFQSDVIRKNCDEVVEKYIESVENLFDKVNHKYKETKGEPRAIKEYSFIELVVDLANRIKLQHKSRKECQSTLKLRVGDNFGYPLQLNIQGATGSGTPLSNNEQQPHVFFYPVNYSMILMGKLLPDINFIRGHLSKTEVSSVSKVTSIDVLNDPYEELEKLLPCTNLLKHELLASIKFVENTENFIAHSINAYIEEAHGERDFESLVSVIDKKIHSLSLVLEKQTEKIDESNEGPWVEFPAVSSENYIAIHSLINYRMIAVKEQLEILREICGRQFAAIPLFNLEVMERVLLDQA